MSFKLLTTEHEEALIKHMLKNTGIPLHHLGNRYWVKSYYLNDQIPDGMILGSFDDEKLLKTCIIEIRLKEVIIKNLIGDFTQNDLNEVLTFSRKLIQDCNYNRVINIALKRSYKFIDVDALADQGYITYSKDYPPFQMSDNKTYWLNMFSSECFKHYVYTFRLTY